MAIPNLPKIGIESVSGISRSPTIIQPLPLEGVSAGYVALSRVVNVTRARKSAETERG